MPMGPPIASNSRSELYAAIRRDHRAGLGKRALIAGAPTVFSLPPPGQTVDTSTVRTTTRDQGRGSRTLTLPSPVLILGSASICPRQSPVLFSAIRRIPGPRLDQTHPAPSLAATSPAPKSVTSWSTTPTRGPPVSAARHRQSTAQREWRSAAAALAFATHTVPYDRECTLSIPSVELTNQAIDHTSPDLFGSGFGEQ